MIKIILWVLLGLIVVTVLYQTIRIWRLISNGRELAQTAVAYEQAPENPELSILFLGDSSGVGTGADKPEQSVAGRVGQAYPKATVTNKSINGQRTKGLLNDFDADALGQHDLLVVHIGGNDVLHRTNLVDLENDLEQLVEKTKDVGKTVVFISGGDFAKAPIYPWPANIYYGNRSRAVRDVFNRVTSDGGVLYLNLVKAEDENPYSGEASVFYASDSFHLSGEGYAYWFSRLKPLLEEAGF